MHQQLWQFLYISIFIFLPTLITIAIYHFSVLQAFKTEVKELIDHAVVKHKLEDLESRQSKNADSRTKDAKSQRQR